MYEQLLVQHRQILELIGSFERFLVEPVPPADVPAMQDVQWRLVSLLLGHLNSEDRQLLLPLERDERPHVAALARQSKQQLETLYERCRAHVMEWPTNVALANWSEYRRDALGLLQAIRVRIDDKERDLYPLVVGGDEAVLPAQPAERNWIAPAWDLRERIFAEPEKK